MSECREIKSINEIIMALVLKNLPANAYHVVDNTLITWLIMN